MKKHSDPVIQEIDDPMIAQFRAIDHSGINIYDKDHSFIMDDSAIISSDIELNPFRSRDCRIILIKKGSVDYLLNYVDNHASAGELLMIPANFIIKINGYSKDFKARGIAFRPSSIMADDPLEYNVIKLRLGYNEERLFETYLQLMNQVLIHPTSGKFDFELLLRSMLRRIRCLNIAQNGYQSVVSGTRKRAVFSGFMQLVNEEGIAPRSITAYAKILNVTDNYLSVIVKELSGRTVMDWVNGRTITDIKALLLDQRKLSIDQIAEKMKFASTSQMIRLFKNQTGYTPAAFRKEKNEMLKGNQTHS